MKTMIIGHRGQLGRDLAQAFADHELILMTQQTIQVQDRESVFTALESHRPDLVLNCSAFHRVDDCEEQVQQAFDVNVFGVRNLALAARSTGAVLAHFSTDYIFDGPARQPYPETAYPSPKCIYGVSKLAGEVMLASLHARHFIFRSSGLYGYAGSREKGTNFVETMIGLARKGVPIRVVDDQVLTPTSTADLAAAVRRATDSSEYGLYHLTSAGQCSWFEFTQAIMEFAGLSPELTPVTSDAFPTRAKRPSYSVLDNERYRALGDGDMPHWRDALERYVKGRAAAGRV